MKTSWGTCSAAAALMALCACGGGHGDAATSTSVPTSATASTTSSAPSSSSASPTSSSSTASASAPKPSRTASTPGSATSSASGGGSVAVPKAAAVRLSIPSIGLDHGIVPGGLNGGVLNPPGGVIQQFTGYGRVSPGRAGISVLAGHVTLDGPDVFYALPRTPVGARVTIGYADGTHKDFTVTSKASVEKTALQNDSRVWGGSTTPVIALVTCDSASSWANAQHHTNNFVVWASPA